MWNHKKKRRCSELPISVHGERPRAFCFIHILIPTSYSISAFTWDLISYVIFFSGPGLMSNSGSLSWYSSILLWSLLLYTHVLDLCSSLPLATSFYDLAWLLEPPPYLDQPGWYHLPHLAPFPGVRKLYNQFLNYKLVSPCCLAEAETAFFLLLVAVCSESTIFSPF